MKQIRTIVTFPNTHAALAAEKFIADKGIGGRIIPVPTEISAECGLALSMDPQVQDDFVSKSQEAKLVYSQIYRLEI